MWIQTVGMAGHNSGQLGGAHHTVALNCGRTTDHSIHGSTPPSPGADINTQASDSASALYEACKNEHEDVVEFLLSQGADANKANKDGLLPLHVASKKGNYRSVCSPHHAQHSSLGMPKEGRVGQGTCSPWSTHKVFPRACWGRGHDGLCCSDEKARVDRA